MTAIAGILYTVVLDTNVIVSGTILRGGAPFAILEAWRTGAFRLVSSAAQRAELEGVLRRPKFARYYSVGHPEIEAILNRLDRDADMVAPVTVLPVSVRDPDDERILAIALGGDADLLVTGDKDLLALAGDPRLGKLHIVDPGAFALELQL